MKIVAIANHKGGTGKTTTTLALGAALAAEGRRTLVVDLDPQASLTLAAGITAPTATIWNAMEQILATSAPPAAESLIHALPTSGLHLLPASLTLAAADLALLNAERREYVLADLLATLRADYDVVLIDCPPSLNLLVINALTASHEVLIPVQPDYLAVGGLSLFMQTIDRVKTRKLNPHLRISGLVLTMTSYTTTHDRAYIPQLHGLAKRYQIPVLAEVPRATRVRDAAAAGVPITTFAARHPAAQAYAQLADKLILRWGLARAAGVEVLEALTHV